jgi:hypothetical protein
MAVVNPHDREVDLRVRRKAVETAQAILNGNLGLVEGGRQLSTLSHYLVADLKPDDELFVFDEIDVETRQIPVGDMGVFADPASLAEHAAILRRIEAMSRPAVEAACRSLISRFG